MNVTLLHVPPSFYSQIARLGLAEKGVSHRERFVIAGPPAFDSYRPWYMRLNPQGTVPTLLVGDDALADSRDILEQLDTRFDGPALSPDDPEERAAMQAWLDRLYAIPVRVWTYGAPRLRKIGARMNRLRLRALAYFARRHPELAEVYEAKRRDIEGFARDATREEAVAAVQAQIQRELDALDATLSDRAFIAGPHYSLADVAWTVLVARCIMVGESPLEGRPALTRWYRSVEARPSFRRADVWDRFRPRKLLRVLATRFGMQALLLALVVAVLAWAVTSLG
jgi:ganglioside-induced differentiation-associated protein 1